MIQGNISPGWLYWIKLEERGKGTLKKNNEPFSTAKRSERVETFFFAQRAEVPADQNRAGARGPDQVTLALCGAQQSSKYTTSLLNVAYPSQVLFAVE